MLCEWKAEVLLFNISVLVPNFFGHGKNFFNFQFKQKIKDEATEEQLNDDTFCKKWLIG